MPSVAETAVAVGDLGVADEAVARPEVARGALQEDAGGAGLPLGDVKDPPQGFRHGLSTIVDRENEADRQSWSESSVIGNVP